MCFSATAENCQLVRHASLDLTLDAAGGPTVPMSITGHQLQMLVDTGGIYSMLTKHRVSELGLVERTVQGIRIDSGKHQLDHYVEAKDLVLGKMTGNGTKMLVMPDDLAAPDVDGTLAPDFLSQFDVEFDFAHARINLFAPLTCDTIPIYWTNAAPFAELSVRQDQWKHMFVNAVLDGKTLTVQIDTGSSTSWMSIDTAKSIFGLSDNDLRKVVNSSGGLAWYSYTFQELAIGDVKVQHPRIILMPERNGDDAAKIVLGMDVLRHLRFYVSYKKSKIFATPSAAVALGADGKASP
jgi:predicted aspartyl protease